MYKIQFFQHEIILFHTCIHSVTVQVSDNSFIGCSFNVSHSELFYFVRLWTNCYSCFYMDPPRL